jgi:methylated-DNA-[protein]-cysteine S-methyltransferase
VIHTSVDSPLGPLLLAGDGRALRRLDFCGSPEQDWRRDDEAFADAREQLAEYFAGRRESFDLALEPVGTPFQLRVWEELRRIPYGATITYADLARRAGRPAAPRAAGHANGRNPIPVIVPCHRVVGTDGSLTGYGGGLESKRFLLELEATATSRRASARPS